jgi:D-glycero-alpha-D-manno-heptose 1-phosphate guanylyltransferase
MKRSTKSAPSSILLIEASAVTVAIILAGGLGTRLASAVPDVPKPMALVRGRPFIEHLMDHWIGQGIDRIVLSVGYKRQLIMDHFGSSYRGINVSYAVEEQPLGTGGGLLLAAQGLSEPFVVLNGDTFFDVNLKALSAFHLDRGSRWTFALFRTGDTDRYMGIDVGDDWRIRSLTSSGKGAGQLANGGIYIVEPSALAASPSPPGSKLSLEYDLLPLVMSSGGQIFGMESQGRFIDIGVPDDYFRASEVLP